MKQSLGKGTLFLATSSVIFILASYLTNVWLGRYLGPEKYGVYSVLISLMTVINIMQVSGLPQAVSKFTAEGEFDSEAVLASGLRLQIAMTVAVGIIFFLSAPLLGMLFRNYSFIGYVREMAFIFPLYGIFALYAGYFNGLHNFRKQAKINSIYSIAKLVLVVLLTITFGLWGTIAGFVTAPLVALLFGFKLPRSKKHFPQRQLLLYAVPLISFAVISNLQISIDLFSIKVLIADPKVAGYYSAAQNIALISFVGLSSLGQVLFPYISRLKGSNRHREMQALISDSLRNLLLLLLPLSALIAGGAPSLIRLLFGKAYLPAVMPLRVLVLGYILITVFTVFANILNGAGHARITTLLTAGGTLVGVGGCIVLIPIWGGVGAATATGLGGLLACTGAMVATARKFSYRVSVISLSRITLGSTILLALGWLVKEPPLLLPLWWVLLAAIYATWLILSGELAKSDWENILELLPNSLVRKFAK